MTRTIRSLRNFLLQEDSLSCTLSKCLLRFLRFGLLPVNLVLAYLPSFPAIGHHSSTCDITAIDAAKIEDLDGDAAAAAAAEYKSKMDAAAPESMERSEAEIGYDTANAILEALGRNQA